MTVQRRMIKDVIMGSKRHMTADEIYSLARERMPGIAIGTVYRNLGLMVEAGEIMRISTPGMPDMYDRNPEPHEHLRCDRCGQTVDVHVERLAEYIEQCSGMKISGYNLALRGLCEKCALEEQAKAARKNGEKE